MSGEPFQCGYGAIVNEDVSVLERCLTAALGDAYVVLGERPRPLRVLEIGMHDGGTAQGIERWCRIHAIDLDYIGIDPDDGKSRPRYVPENGRVVIGDSAEVFSEIPGGLDLIWCDGCHCINHVALDTLHYERKVRRGGFMLFHDVNPVGQGKEHQYHGPEYKEFGLAIDMAHKLIGWPHDGWELFAEAWPTDRHNCGTRAYRKGTT